MQPQNPLQSAPGGFSLATGLVATAHFANDALTSMFPALLPSLGARFELRPSELALLASAFAVSTAMPQPLFGFLADRLGGRHVGALGLAVSAAFVAALALVPSTAWLLVVLVVGGLGSSALHPAGVGLARASSSQNPGLAVAIFSSAGMAGGALGPVVAIALASVFGFAGLAWVALPVLLVAALLAKLGPTPAPVENPVRAKGFGLGLFKGPIAWLSVVSLLGSLVMLTFTSAIPVWLVTERGLAETSPVIGLTLATFSLAAAAGGILGGVLGRSLPPTRLVVGSLALAVLPLLAVLLATPGSAPYTIAVALGGALLGLHGPLVIARAQELAPGAESAVAGVLLGATWGVAGIIYAGFGTLQSVVGLGGTLAAVSLLVLPAAHIAAATLKYCNHPSSAHRCPDPCARELRCCAALAATAQ